MTNEKTKNIQFKFVKMLHSQKYFLQFTEIFLAALLPEYIRELNGAHIFFLCDRTEREHTQTVSERKISVNCRNFCSFFTIIVHKISVIWKKELFKEYLSRSFIDDLGFESGSVHFESRSSNHLANGCLQKQSSLKWRYWLHQIGDW